MNREIQEPSTLNDVINRRSTIKGVAYAMLFIAGIATYELAWTLAGLITQSPVDIDQDAAMRDDMNRFVRNAMITTVGTFLVTLVYTICAIGLLKLKQWASLLFHALSLVLAVVISGLFIYIYFVYPASPLLPDSSHIDMLGILIRSQVGILITIILWIIVRVNMLFLSKAYRHEFK